MGARFRRELIEATSGWPEWLKPVTKETAVLVDEAVRQANDAMADGEADWSERSDKIEHALQVFNDVTGCFGVEGIVAMDLPDKRRRNWAWDSVSYANTGETYRATLLFDYLKLRFIVGDWGSYCFETLEREAYEEGIMEGSE